MPSKRILAVSLLFPIITVTTIFVFHAPFTTPSLRIDPIPAGAYIIPWITPNPSVESLSMVLPQYLPWNIDTAMTAALKLQTTFRITVPNGTRTVASTIYLGHDSNYLYVGGTFKGIYWNPTSNSSYQWANYLRIILDTDNDGRLSVPEAGSEADVYVWCPFIPKYCSGGGWRSEGAPAAGYVDLAWTSSDPLTHRPAVVQADTVCNQPSTAGNLAWEYNVDDGTMVVLYSKHLRSSILCGNGLQVKIGERWVIGFLLEVGYSNGYAAWQDFVDGWPRTAYPYLSNDASWWPKFALDLTNPPPGY